MMTVDAVSALGDEWDVLFDRGPDLQSTRAWFAATEEAAVPLGARPRYFGLVGAGGPLALLPMLAGPGRAMCSLTSPYTVSYQPLLAPDADPAAVGQALARHLRRWPVTMLDALDPAWPPLQPFIRGLNRGGLRVLPFDQFGNWHERVAGLDWDAYLAARPGALRETLRRKGRVAAKDPSIRIQVIDDGVGWDAALEAYEAVRARSWKQAEPFPRFNAALLSRLAPLGALRMGVLWQGETPLAAQYWTLHRGVATVLKLAHDDAAKALSPGSLLTAHMIRLLMERDGATALDFGRGDDPYKRDWVGVRRQRIGLALVNPLLPGGLLALVRHHAGGLVRRVRRRGRRRG